MRTQSAAQIHDLRSIALTLAGVTSQNPDPGWQRPEDSSVRPASARLVDPEDDLGSATYGGDFQPPLKPDTGMAPIGEDRWLISKQERWFASQSGGNCDALLLPS